MLDRVRRKSRNIDILFPFNPVLRRSNRRIKRQFLGPQHSNYLKYSRVTELMDPQADGNGNA